MKYRIRVGARGWGCSPLGGSAVHFQPGDYDVPEQMSEFLAGRCIRSGRGMRLKEKTQSIIGQVIEDGEIQRGKEVFEPRPRKMKGRAPENKSAS